MSSKFWENKSGNPKIWMKLSYETRPTDKRKRRDMKLLVTDITTLTFFVSINYY